MKVKVGGSWRDGKAWVKVGGTWRQGVATWVKVSGVWKKMSYGDIWKFTWKNSGLTLVDAQYGQSKTFKSKTPLTFTQRDDVGLTKFDFECESFRGYYLNLYFDCATSAQATELLLAFNARKFGLKFDTEGGDVNIDHSSTVNWRVVSSSDGKSVRFEGSSSTTFSKLHDALAVHNKFSGNPVIVSTYAI